MTAFLHRLFSSSPCAAALILALSAYAGAAEQSLSIKDYTWRGFAPDLVQYRVETDAAKAKSLRVFDGSGTAVPSQWEADASGKGGTIGFVTALPLDATVTNVVKDTGGPTVPGKLVVTPGKERTVLATALLSVNVPGAADRVFAKPVKANTLPAPILSFTSSGSPERGASAIFSERLVKRLRTWISAQGPVYADAWYEITWAEGGFYRCRVRVIDGVPIARVMEEFDLGKFDGSDGWELALTAGWKPDQVEKAQPWGNGEGADPGSVGPMEAFTSKPQWRMGVDNANLGHLGFFRKEDQAAKPNGYPMAGVVLMNRGEWRRATGLQVLAPKPDDVRVRFPMTAREANWQQDSGSVSSPFSTHSIDPQVPPTLGRRAWGLMLSQVRLPTEEGAAAFFAGPHKVREDTFSRLPPFSRGRSVYGIVTLDQYKDYVLDWPEGQVTYPRLGKSGQGVTRDLSATTKELRWMTNLYLSWPTPSHHVTAGNYESAWHADNLLGSGTLTPEQRKELRARLALVLYLHNDANIFSYGVGSHPGNPNMPLARFFPGVAYAGLLPDHPMYGRWVDFMSRQTEYELGKSVAPGGAWVEYGAYHFHGFRILPGLPSLAAAKAPNIERLFDYCRADLDYTTNLLSAPDPRWGARMVPGLANSGPATTERLVEGANVFQQKDPEFASQLLWAWKENSARPGLFPAPDLQPKPAELTSRYFPGFGVIFRAHPGPQETWMMFRSGYLWSHWTTDPGHFSLISRGAVMVPFQAFQYGDSPDKGFDLHNTVRFGATENAMVPWNPDTNVLDYAFGPSVDYAWSSVGVPAWFIQPGASPDYQQNAKRSLAPDLKQTEGVFQWDRQVLFLKGKTAASPNYFVMRDSTRGEGHLASWQNFNLLGRKGDLKVDGSRLTLDTEWPVKLDILYAQPSPLATPALLEDEQRIQTAGVSAKYDSKKNPPGVEQRLLVRIPAAADEGYFYVLYPREAAEASPAVKKLADGVMKIAHREGTDYAFLSSLPITFAGEDVQFEGCAGSVRVTKDEIVLALTGGSGRVGYKGRVLEGAAPLEKRFPIGALKPASEKRDALAYKVTMPAWEGGDQVSPGLSKKVEGDVIHYRLLAKQSFIAAAETVRAEGRDALIEVEGDRVRFIVPDRQYVRLSVRGIGIRGMGPFDLTFTPDRIAGTVDGPIRTLVTSWPSKITRPMFRIDARRWYAGWSDVAAISKSPETPDWAIAFGVREGVQKIEISEWDFPPPPERPPVKSVKL